MFEPIDRVMKMRQGGSAVPRRTDIGGQDHMLSYITPQEAGILQLLGGSGEPGPAGIPAFRADPGQMAGRDDYGGGDRDRDRGGGITAADLADDENYDQSLQQDIAMGNFAKAGGDDRGFSYGNNYMGDGQYTPARDSYANAMSGLAGLRDFYSDPNDPFGTDGTGRGLGRGAYDATMGITGRNPYGYKGMYSRVLGFDPRNVDYSAGPGAQSARTRAAIAANQFSKYANPQNIKGRVGFNPQFPDASVTDPGRLRAGLQSGLFPRSFETAYGPTTTYNVQRSPMDTVALLAMPGGLGLLADQLSNKTAGVAPSDLFDRASQKFGTLSGSQTDSGFRPADATATGDFSPFGSLTQGIGQGIGAMEDLVGGAFRGAGDFFNRIDPEQGRRAAAQRTEAQPNLAAADSVFGNFFSNVQDKITGIPSGIASIFDRPPAPVSTSSLDFMAPVQETRQDIRDRLAAAAETQQELDAFSMGLPGVSSAQPASTVTREFITGTSEDFSPAQQEAIDAAGNAAAAEAIRSGTNPTIARERAKNKVKLDALRSNQQSSLDPDRVIDALTSGVKRGVPTTNPVTEQLAFNQESSVGPDLFGVNRRQVSTVSADKFFRENPEALANIDSDFVRSRVMNPEANQGFFVDQSTGEISIELPGGDGIRAPVANVSGMSAPIDFSLPSLSDITDALLDAGSAIKGLASNPYRAEAERRRTTSGNVFRPSN
tara:strand:- start:401 stop:2545 length:2145 start_codon:yes stop_codon:yes gene_type:complete